MARYWTLAEIISKVEKELDLEGESLVQDDEMVGYVNEAIDEAEAEIHGIYEDYFLSKTALTLVSGTDEYDMPSTIYAHKIRRVMYRNGAIVYTIKRARDWKKFEKYTLGLTQGSQTLEYEYMILNTTPGEPKMLFMPPVGESGAYVTVWHIRNANRLVDDDDVCDIPEFVNFVTAYVKVKCLEKENTNPLYPGAMQSLEMQRKLMHDTLSSMVPDADNQIEADASFYEDMN